MLNRKISVDAVVARLINENGAAHGLVFTWMIAHLDRDGRMTGDPLAVKGMVAPMLADVSEETVSEMLSAAVDLGLVELYEDDRGQRFVSYPKFEANQIGLRYKREPVSDFPDPDVCRKLSGSLPETFRKNAGKDPEVFRKSSGSDPAEGNGIEGNGNKGKGRKDLSESLCASDGPITGVVKDIWNHYRRWHPRASIEPGEKNSKLCRARLKEGFSPDDLKQSIDGYHRSPFHCGKNDNGTKYLDFSLIMRDQGHVQKGIEMATDPDLGRTANSRRATDGVLEWLSKTAEADDGA
jgi:hypothetical protein